METIIPICFVTASCTRHIELARTVARFLSPRWLLTVEIGERDHWLSRSEHEAPQLYESTFKQNDRHGSS